MKMRVAFSLAVCFSLFSFRLWAQQIDPVYDMGEIKAGDSRFADFDWLNDKLESVFILRADVPEDCSILFSTKELKPSETGMIRIQFNPRHKGPFQRKIPVYFSSQNDPVILVVRGNVQYVEENQDLACPNFNTPEEDKQVKEKFTVQVINKVTGEPIPAAAVQYNPNPLFRPLSLTGQDGTTKASIPVGLYTLQATAKGYNAESQELYIGKGVTSTVFMLDPQEQPVSQIPKDSQLVLKEKTKPVHTIAPPLKENPGELPIADFAPNNIVFLIDISSSMGYPDKLPLLKIAMKNLLNSLRSIDRVSIVTYASGTNVLLESTTAEKKDKIARKIDDLKAAGSTEGGKGIHEAYKVAEDHFINDGNNIIILATDGDFNLDKSDDALFSFIEENSVKGISMSVVGFGKKEKAIEKMHKIADSGKGSYMHVSTEDDAGPVLLEEIKLRSRRQ